MELGVEVEPPGLEDGFTPAPFGVAMPGEPMGLFTDPVAPAAPVLDVPVVVPVVDVDRPRAPRVERVEVDEVVEPEVMPGSLIVEPLVEPVPGVMPDMEEPDCIPLGIVPGIEPEVAPGWAP